MDQGPLAPPLPGSFQEILGKLLKLLDGVLVTLYTRVSPVEAGDNIWKVVPDRSGTSLENWDTRVTPWGSNPLPSATTVDTRLPQGDCNSRTWEWSVKYVR